MPSICTRCAPPTLRSMSRASTSTGELTYIESVEWLKGKSHFFLCNVCVQDPPGLCDRAAGEGRLRQGRQALHRWYTSDVFYHCVLPPLCLTVVVHFVVMQATRSLSVSSAASRSWFPNLCTQHSTSTLQCRYHFCDNKLDSYLRLMLLCAHASFYCRKRRSRQRLLCNAPPRRWCTSATTTGPRYLAHTRTHSLFGAAAMI